MWLFLFSLKTAKNKIKSKVDKRLDNLKDFEIDKII